MADNIRKRIRELKDSLDLSSQNDVLEFLLHHFDDKALEVNIERAIIFEDGRRAGRAEMEAQVCAEVSQRLKAALAPTFRQEQELVNLRKEKEALQERVVALEKAANEVKEDDKALAIGLRNLHMILAKRHKK